MPTISPISLPPSLPQSPNGQNTTQRLALAIQDNDVSAVQTALREVDRSDPSIVAMTENALISDAVCLDVKTELLAGSGIDIDKEISNGESVRGYAIRRDDEGLIKALTAHQTHQAENNFISDSLTLKSLSLTEKLIFDALAALGTTGAAGTIATLIDKSVVENISGKNTIQKSLQDSFKQLFTQPQRLLPAYEAVAIACGATYVTANAIETMANHYKQDCVIPKLITTTIVNAILSIRRDCILAGLYGKGPIKSLPAASIASFVTRDGFTMTGTFAFPIHVKKYLQDECHFSQKYATWFAQVICPVAMQIVAAPFHILGFDYYNRPNVDFSNRWQTIRATYLPSTLGRASRIGWVYGIVPSINTYLRGKLAPSE